MTDPLIDRARIAAVISAALPTIPGVRTHLDLADVVFDYLHAVLTPEAVYPYIPANKIRADLHRRIFGD